MKKVQGAIKQHTALDELCKRYENRGITYDRGSESAKQRSIEVSTRTSAPRSYGALARDSEGLQKYKSGVSGTRRYMTDGDFANYYKATREYTPDANVELDTTILLQKIDGARYKKDKVPKKSEKSDIKKRLREEADRNNPKRGSAHPKSGGAKRTIPPVKKH